MECVFRTPEVSRGTVSPIRLICCLLLFEITQVLFLVDWARHSYA